MLVIAKRIEGVAMLNEDMWAGFFRDGFVHLGQVLSDEEVAALAQRADDLALGAVTNPNVQMQLDTGGSYERLPQAVANFEQGTIHYRKIQGLEFDDLYARLIGKPVFREACARVYGPHAAVSIFRAMVMNKPAGQGTYLPWHQDGGDVWKLDRDPLITIWVALDPATRANGCMECISGSHRLGILTPFGSTVDGEHVALHCRPEQVHPLEVPAGNAVLIHNWLIHRSGVNPSSVPRRAFTMCCMDARTRNVLTGNRFPLIYGSLADEPDAYVHQINIEREHCRQTAAEAERFAISLRDEAHALRRTMGEATAYALDLEAEVARLRESRAKTELYAQSLEVELGRGAAGLERSRR
jgi:hypothetical protein